MEALGVLLILIILSVVVEYLVERIKDVVQVKEVGKIQLVPYYSLAVAIGLALVIQVDFIEVLNALTRQIGVELNTIPVVGYVITGLAISGGSKVAHEFVSKLRESRSNRDEHSS